MENENNGFGQTVSLPPTGGSDPLFLWYPMRVAYGRAERMLHIKEELEREGLECFLPMRVRYEKNKDFSMRSEYVPAVDGLLFVHSTRERITELKMTREVFEPLRYWAHRSSDGHVGKILTVPDRQMQNFMQVYVQQGDHVVLLEYEPYLIKPGQRVVVTQGEFAGTVGTIKRIKKSKCVVVQLEGFAALAIAFVPAAWLRQLNEDEYRELMGNHC